MSVSAMSWVLDHSRARGTARLVLLSIANYAQPSPDGFSFDGWPSIERIRFDANLAKRQTVQEVLAGLVRDGHLDIDPQGAPDKRIRADRRPNLYRIRTANPRRCMRDVCEICAPDGGPSRGTPSDPTGSPPGADGVPSQGATGSPGKGPEPLLEPLEEPRADSLTLVAPPSLDQFDAFGAWWQGYPRKIGRAEAARAFARAVKAGARVEELTRARDAYVADIARTRTLSQFVLHGATFLRSERWRDYLTAPDAVGIPTGQPVRSWLDPRPGDPDLDAEAHA